MPYILLIAGIVLGLYALYRFFKQADAAQARALFLALGAAAVAAGMFYLAVTGRLAAALGLLVALIPLATGFLRDRTKNNRTGRAAPPPAARPMSREEALEILGLTPSASDEDIRNAYKTLIKKVHPDHEGSEWMAAKLNEAKDFLLKDRTF